MSTGALAWLSPLCRSLSAPGRPYDRGALRKVARHDCLSLLAMSVRVVGVGTFLTGLVGGAGIEPATSAV